FVQIDQKTPPPSAVAVLIESPSLLLALLKLGVVGGALVSACLCGVSGRSLLERETFLPPVLFGWKSLIGLYQGRSGYPAGFEMTAGRSPISEVEQQDRPA